MAVDYEYNFFICYRGDTGGILAADIYNEILLHSKNTIRPFFAPKCVKKGENFYTACITEAGRVPLMIIILSKGFFDACTLPDDVVYGEIKAAMSNDDTEFMPIIMQGFDFKAEDISKLFTEQEIDRIKHVSALEYRDVYSFSAYEMLLPILREKIGAFGAGDAIDRSPINTAVKRKHISDETKKDYFSTDNKSEIRRLYAQQQLLYNYDMAVYEKHLKNKSNLCVLDIGCSDGKAVMARLGDRPEVAKIVGVEYDGHSVQKANEVYKDTKAHFYQLDLESDDFEDDIEDIMEQNGIEKFDWINVLAVVSHLKSPFKVFKALKKISRAGTVFFVRNIDDGMNFAYPDIDNEFKRAFDILAKCDTVGYRFSGRELYSLFRNLYFDNICLEKFGLSNVGMDFESKTAFFDVIFRFIKNGIVNAVSKHPLDPVLKAEKEWFLSKYDQLEERFVAKETFVNFGFLIYTAIV